MGIVKLRLNGMLRLENRVNLIVIINFYFNLIKIGRCEFFIVFKKKE